MKRGPPPASPDGARNRRLSIPVTDAERERLRAAAGSVPVAAWCRGVVLACAAPATQPAHIVWRYSTQSDPPVVRDGAVLVNVAGRAISPDPRPFTTKDVARLTDTDDDTP